jgi:signal transduction histidine kinase/CheY-like chemotaxis protein
MAESGTESTRHPEDRSDEAANVPADDPEVRLQARVLLIFGVVIVCLSGLWGTMHVRNGVFALGMAYYLVAALFIVSVSWAWRKGARLLACQLSIALGLLWTGVTTYFTGGLRLTNIAPFFALLAAPVFLLGRVGLIWTAVTFASALGFQILRSAGYHFPDLVPPSEREIDALMTWISSAIVIVLFVSAYESSRVRAQQQLRAALSAKSRLLANISHEIRTPLHAVMGMNRLLAEQEPSEERRAMIRTSQENAECLLVLFDDLLDLARLEQGQFKLVPQDFDLLPLVESVTKLVRHFGATKKLDVRLSVAADVPRRLRGDSRRLRQVLVNLGSNAVKFTESGFVEIRASRDPATGDPWACRFTVADSGIGIPAADQARLFQSFTQLDSSLSRRYDGAGLGLAICRDLVEHMGGTIGVASDPGSGSAFTFTIPFAAPADPEITAPQEGGCGPREGGRVLVVDDFEVNRELVHAMLETAGYAVTAAGNAVAGVAAWEAQRPDVVLMDLQMPEMDGMEATRRIRRRENDLGLAPVPIIAMTGHATDECRNACTAAGMTACLFKPFNVAELLDVVDRCRTGSRSAGDEAALVGSIESGSDRRPLVR